MTTLIPRGRLAIVYTNCPPASSSSGLPTATRAGCVDGQLVDDAQRLAAAIDVEVRYQLADYTAAAFAND